MVQSIEREGLADIETQIFQPYFVATDELEPVDFQSIADRIGPEASYQQATNTIFFPIDGQGIEIQGGRVTFIQRDVNTGADFQDQRFPIDATQTVYDTDGSFHFVGSLREPLGRAASIRVITISEQERAFRTLKLTEGADINPAIITAAQKARDRVLEREQIVSQAVRLGQTEKVTIMP